MPRKSNSFNVEYTNKDIMDKLYDMDNKINSIHEQTLKTNGRVNTIEVQQKQNVASFTREKDAFAERLAFVEKDNKMFTAKIAGVVAITSILVSIVMMIIGKLI